MTIEETLNILHNNSDYSNNLKNYGHIYSNKILNEEITKMYNIDSYFEGEQ